MDRRSLLSYFDPEPAEWSLFDPWRFALQSFGHHHGASLLPRHSSSDIPLLFDQYLKELQKDFESVQSFDENGFNFRLDVQEFKPEEITVTLKDNIVIVEGKHEERSDAHGTISRQFTRKFALPKGQVDVEKLQSNLSSDGILTINAPKLQAIEGKSRTIPITKTGPAKKEIKDQKKETNGATEEKKQEKNGDKK
uniref:CSON002823 protein n=1 Tax=Culicoides sonorensis TaxID=179676 RepID=A0A336K7P8_CULSO